MQDLESDFAAQIAKYKSAMKLFKEDRNRAFEAKATDDHIKLLLFQKSMETEYPSEPFVGASVIDTLVKLFSLGLLSKANKLRHDFSISERR